MWNRLGIATKLAIGFGAVVALALLIGVLAWSRVDAIGAEWKQFETGTLKKREAVAAGFLGLQEGIHHFKSYVLRGGDYARKFESNLDLIGKAVAGYRRSGGLAADEEKLLRQLMVFFTLGQQDARRGAAGVGAGGTPKPVPSRSNRG